MVYHSYSEKDTFEFAVCIGAAAKPGEVYCLEGELGAGKTVFTKGFAQGLHIEGHITSPTFTIVNEYQGQGQIPLYHFDLYRLHDADDLYETGFEDYFYGDGVCIIEWGSRFMAAIPENAAVVLIEKNLSQGDDYRKITVQGREKE